MKNKVKTKKTKNGALTVLVHQSRVWVMQSKDLDKFIEVHSFIKPEEYDEYYTTDEIVEIEPEVIKQNVVGLKPNPNDKEIEETSGFVDLVNLAK
jgi:hypothetical protein